MAILSNGEIKERLNAIPPLVECPDKDHPFDINLQVQPASVDLRLSNSFFKYKREIQFIDTQINQEKYIERFTIDENEPLILRPNEFINGQTLEILNLSEKICARVELRSSLARFGVLTHTATYMNPGYKGPVPLQLKNLSNKPIIIRPFIRICTVIFEELKTPSEKPYNKREDAKYLIEKSISPSKLFLDPELQEKMISEFKIKDVIKKSDKFKLFIEDIEFVGILKDILFEIISEALFLAKSKGKTHIELADIEKASKNIAKIYKYIY